LAPQKQAVSPVDAYTRSEPDKQAQPKAWSRRTMRQAFLLPDTLQREAIGSSA